MVETSVATVKTSIEDFTHSQKSLTSYVQNFKQDVEISIAGYLSTFQQYIQKRTKGTQTTVRYIAASTDTFQATPDNRMIVPFNDVVTDPLGNVAKDGIRASIAGLYQITATLAGVKG